MELCVSVRYSLTLFHVFLIWLPFVLYDFAMFEF
jgi:hypothetical protein